MRYLNRLVALCGATLMQLAWLALQALPADALGCRARGLLYRRRLRRAGLNLQVAVHAVIEHPQGVSVGDHVYVGHGTWISGIGRGIELGDEVMIGPYVTMVSSDHRFENGSARFAPGRSAPIVVGRGTWIAARATVTAGVTIGRGALVAAGAVVTRDVEDYAIVAGAPARKIGDTRGDRAAGPAVGRAAGRVVQEFEA